GLGDNSLTGASRRSVVEDLFAAKISASGLRLLVRIVSRERPGSFGESIHGVAELARHMAETGHGLDERSPGRSMARAMMAGYAAAVLEALPHKSQLDEVEDELFRFARIVEADASLRQALSETGRSLADRQDLVRGLLAGKVADATLALVCEALRSRARDVVGSLDFLAEQVAEARGWRVARVQAAEEIGPEERSSLAAALQLLSGLPTELQVTIDPALLGGVVVEVGDVVIDASARHRLDQLREHLLGPEGATGKAKEPN
ncbi:MAG: F0F1 ATP synthase subunit delta, partial [Acidimicrobiales bacterium]